jgi:putative transposase
VKNRDYKNFAENCYFHIYNRGNGKQEVFLDDEDRKFFLFRLKENLFPKSPEDRLLGDGFLVAEAHTPYIRKTLPPNSFSLLAYCLMPNHFHFLIRQNTVLPVSKLISKVFTSYSKYFNAKYERVGHVFQDRFKAVLVVNDSQLTWLTAYIHQNPKVGGLVTNLRDYQWSSYLDYIGIRNGTLCDKSFILKMFTSSIEYEKFVEVSYGAIKQRKDIELLLLD